ncbi:hypothetical protein A9Q84_03285 [Halobacteriovorax marinus]|uniref:Uncharacterized protein n=1 Tax=Halobacteriovorax marinus TaxID=97084 RepID=A0A1Y5F9W0_9BACT|nr:hypothetical protein A9Q84_03285 [Halobacteriovorax marinus]
MKKKPAIIKIALFIIVVTTFVYSNFFIYTFKHYTYEPKIVDGKMEPRFPSYFEAFRTVQGIDSNKDGLRDDLEIFANERLENQPYEIREVAKLDLRNWSLFTTQSMGELERKIWWQSYWRINSCFSILHGSFVKALTIDQYFSIKRELKKDLTNTRERQRAVDTNWAQMSGSGALDINESMYNLVEICNGMKVNLCEIIDNSFKKYKNDSSHWDEISFRQQPKLYKDYHEKCHKK